MRIPSGTTDQGIYFVAVDATDLKTRETGLSGFTVYRARNGAAAAAMTTPTVTEVDATNLPGVYHLLLDEDMTIGSGNDSEEMVFHITVSGMAPVTRVIELYRPKITLGATLATADIASILEDTGTTLPTTLAAIAGYIDTEVGAIKAVTDNLPDSGALTTLTTNVASILTDTGTTLPGTLAAIEGKIDTVDGIVDEILLDTAEIGADGAGLSAIPWNASWDAEVESEVTDALVAIHLDHLLAVDYDPAAKPGVATALFNEIIESDAGVARFTANALEQAPGGGGGGDATEANQTAILAALTTIDGIVDAILVDTGTTLPAAIAAIDAGSGSGAYAITVTVTDGTDPLEGATVRLIEGVNNFVATTDASGNASFSLDAATYAVTVTKAGYSFTPATRTVTGTQTGTLVNDLEMAAITVAAISTGVRTADFRGVLHGLARRKGLDPDVNLQPNEAAALTEYIASAYEFIWRWYEWPESISIEQVTFTDQAIARTGVTSFPIDQVFAVTQRHPITSASPQTVPFRPGAGNIYVTDASKADSSLYVVYRRPCPRFTATAYSASATYAVGDLIYFTDGDCYECLAATTAGQSPTTTAAKWQKQEIIAYLRNALLHAALGETLREEGQHSTSMLEDGQLQGYLEDALDRLELDQAITRYLRTTPR